MPLERPEGKATAPERSGFFLDPNGLGPVRGRARWIVGSLLLEAVGVGTPVAVVLHQARKDSFTGQISRASVQLAWHEILHTRVDAVLLVAGAVVFAIGAVLVARPFVTRKTTLLVAIPLAALVGVLVLGGIALIVAFIILFVDLGFDLPGGKKKNAPVNDEAEGAGRPGQNAPPGT